MGNRSKKSIIDKKIAFCRTNDSPIAQFVVYEQFSASRCLKYAAVQQITAAAAALCVNIVGHLKDMCKGQTNKDLGMKMPKITTVDGLVDR